MSQIESTGPGLGQREVTIERTGPSRYVARNARGGELTFAAGEGSDFTPVELLLAAIAGCSAIDVELITAKRDEPQEFTALASGTKIRDEHGNRMVDIEVDFRVTFSAGPDGDRAREMLPKAVAMSRDRLCTVSRTVQVGTPITMSADGAAPENSPTEL